MKRMGRIAGLLIAGGILLAVGQHVYEDHKAFHAVLTWAVQAQQRLVKLEAAVNPPTVAIK